MAAIFGEVELFTSQWLLLALVLVLGSLPFCAIGLAIGLYVSSSGAPAIVNLIYLPMAFLSGLWVPIMMFPDLLQTIANLLPAYHLAQLSLKVVAMDIGDSVFLHLGILVAYFILFMFFAAIAYYKKDKS